MRIKATVSGTGIEVEGDLDTLRKIHWSRTSSTEFALEFVTPEGDGITRHNYCPCCRSDHMGDCNHTLPDEWFLEDQESGVRLRFGSKEDAEHAFRALQIPWETQPYWKLVSLPPLPPPERNTA